MKLLKNKLKKKRKKVENWLTHQNNEKLKREKTTKFVKKTMKID